MDKERSEDISQAEQPTSAHESQQLTVEPSSDKEQSPNNEKHIPHRAYTKPRYSAWFFSAICSFGLSLFFPLHSWSFIFFVIYGLPIIPIWMLFNYYAGLSLAKGAHRSNVKPSRVYILLLIIHAVIILIVGGLKSIGSCLYCDEIEAYEWILSGVFPIAGFLPAYYAAGRYFNDWIKDPRFHIERDAYKDSL